MARSKTPAKLAKADMTPHERWWREQLADPARSPLVGQAIRTDRQIVKWLKKMRFEGAILTGFEKRVLARLTTELGLPA